MTPVNVLKVPPFMDVKQEQRAKLKPPYKMAVSGPLYCEVKIDLTQRRRNLYDVVGLPADPEFGKALVDTGAVATCIDEGVATALGLETIDRGSFQNMLQTSVALPLCSAAILFAGYAFEIRKAAVVDLQRFGLISLIGRDILHFGDLRYCGDKGDWEFKIPGLSPS